MDDRDEMLRQYLSTKYLTTPPQEVRPDSVTSTADDNTQDLTTESTPGNTKAEAVKNDGYANAADDSGVKAARAGRDRSELISNVGRSLSHMFTARAQANGYKPDDGVYDSIAKSGQAGVDEAQAARSSAIQSYLTKRKMGQEDAATTRQTGLDADNLAQQAWENTHKESESARQADQFNTSNDRLMEVGHETHRHNVVDENIARGKAAAGPKPEKYTDKDGNERVGVLTNQLPTDPIIKPAALDIKPDQSKAAGFGRRLEQSEAVFKDLEKGGYDRAGSWENAKSYLPNGMQPHELQQQEQAERNFANALLRRESGSAIGKDEFTSAEQQYFPRAGDSPQVKAQKAANRATAIQGLLAEAGPNALKQLPQGAPPAPSGPAEGSTSTSGGIPIVFRGGKWVKQ